MKIAVIGSGISGLSASYYLSKKHKVDLFEKDDHFGGHSFTAEVQYDNKNSKKIAVDIGFIVFNHITDNSKNACVSQYIITLLFNDFCF